LHDQSPRLSERRIRPFLRRLYRLLFAGMIDMDFKAVRRHVILLEVIAFELVILFIWWSEYLGLASMLGAPKMPFNWQRPLLPTVWVLLLLGFIVAVTRVFFKQIHYLEGFLQVCSFCKSIRVGDKWVPLEEFMQQRAEVKMSHSLCPPCALKHYGYSEDDEPEQSA